MRHVASHWAERVSADLRALLLADSAVADQLRQFGREAIKAADVGSRGSDDVLHSSNATRVLLMRYEDTVADTDARRQAVYRWLGLGLLMMMCEMILS